MLHVKQILIVARGVSISSDVIRVCSEEGIPLHFLEKSGTPIAALYASGLTGTVLTRRAQLLAYTTDKSVTISKTFVTGKLENQLNLLRYLGKSRKEEPSYPVLQEQSDAIRDALAEIPALAELPLEDFREHLLALEGRAAQHYWRGIREIIPQELEWPGRETRGAQDLFNSILNYGYGVLYAQIEQAIILAGLDPYAGFLHTDRPGKPSLVLDLIEEFRQCIVDRTVIGLLNKHVPLEQDDEHRLTESTRRKIAEKALERLDGSTELYEGKRQVLRFIMQCQARHLASFLRGDRDVYTAFVAGW